jgi:hypothetical protein
VSYITDFLNKYLSYAQGVTAATGINTDVVLAQAALESNWGRSTPGNNFFGIKGPGSTQTTMEFIGGKWVQIKAAFSGYASAADSFTGYSSFINKYNRYKPVKEAVGSEAQINALAASGYATDPNYAGKLTSIVGRIQRSGVVIGNNTPPPINTDGVGYGRDALKSILGVDTGNMLSDVLSGTGDVLAAPGNAVEGAVKSLTPDLGGWFQRGAFLIFALILIAAALFAFKGNTIIQTVKGAVT